MPRFQWLQAGDEGATLSTPRWSQARLKASAVARDGLDLRHVRSACPRRLRHLYPRSRRLRRSEIRWSSPLSVIMRVARVSTLQCSGPDWHVQPTAGIRGATFRSNPAMTGSNTRRRRAVQGRPADQGRRRCHTDAQQVADGRHRRHRPGSQASARAWAVCRSTGTGPWTGWGRPRISEVGQGRLCCMQRSSARQLRTVRPGRRCRGRMSATT